MTHGDHARVGAGRADQPAASGESRKSQHACCRILNDCFSRVCEHISRRGLKGLLWVTGLHTEEIAPRIFEVVSRADLHGRSPTGEFCVLLKPGEEPLARPFLDGSPVDFRLLDTAYPDTFLIVNRALVVDMTPTAEQGVEPLVTEDLSRVRLYLGLFHILKSVSRPLTPSSKPSTSRRI